MQFFEIRDPEGHLIEICKEPEVLRNRCSPSPEYPALRVRMSICGRMDYWMGRLKRLAYSSGFRFRRGFLMQLFLVFVILPIRAQEPLTTLRSESNLVLVPTLVRTKAGQITYGLDAKDFVIEDDGIEQSVTLDESPEREPTSLVVALQVGRKASSQFKKKPDLSLYEFGKQTTTVNSPSMFP